MNDIVKLEVKSLVQSQVQTQVQTESIIKQGRRLGNTTRLVDSIIQLLFCTDTIVIVRDHHEDGQDRYCNRLLFDSILSRLEAEHQIIPFEMSEYGYRLIVDLQRLTLRLIKPF